MQRKAEDLLAQRNQRFVKIGCRSSASRPLVSPLPIAAGQGYDGLGPASRFYSLTRAVGLISEA